MKAVTLQDPGCGCEGHYISRRNVLVISVYIGEISFHLVRIKQRSPLTKLESHKLSIPLKKAEEWRDTLWSQSAIKKNIAKCRKKIMSRIQLCRFSLTERKTECQVFLWIPAKISTWFLLNNRIATFLHVLFFWLRQTISSHKKSHLWCPRWEANNA